MRQFFLTHSVIGSIDDQILILTNQQVVLMGLSPYQYVQLIWSPDYKHCIITNNVWMFNKICLSLSMHSSRRKRPAEITIQHVAKPKLLKQKNWEQIHAVQLLRLDVMSLLVDCIFHEIYYKMMFILCSVWNHGKIHTVYRYSQRSMQSTGNDIKSNLKIGQSVVKLQFHVVSF